MEVQSNKNKIKSNLFRLFLVNLTFATFVHGCSKVEVNGRSKNEKEGENIMTTKKTGNGQALGSSISF